MQFLELDCDPWREQPFLDTEESERVRLPVSDAGAMKLYPQHCWIYDKLQLSRSQGIECGPHGVEPTRYPVFCKPATTVKGMGAGSCELWSERDYRANCGPGDFWMRLLSGEHVSTDLAVVAGEAAWCRHALGIPGGQGTFDYWIVEVRTRPRLEKYCIEWVREHLPGYTGMANVESIGGRIIAVHLRSADQWPDLYGRGWLDAMIGLYRSGRWHLVREERSEGYSVVLFGPHGPRYVYPDPRAMAALRAAPGISSIQLTFSENRPPQSHPMPPGGFRLAVINSFDLDAARAVRASMAREFGVAVPGTARRAAG